MMDALWDNIKSPYFTTTLSTETKFLTLANMEAVVAKINNYPVSLPAPKPYLTWNELKAKKGWNSMPLTEEKVIPTAQLVFPEVVYKDKLPPEDMELEQVREPVITGEAKYVKGGDIKPIKQIVLVTGKSETVRVMTPIIISHKFWITVYYSDTHNKSYGYWKTTTSIKWSQTNG